jgi:hypothetical protein
VLRHLGEAIGKLRRLETLYLDSKRQGLEYYRIAQGMAEGDCPALRSVTLSINSGAAWLACQPSIIRPSVRYLRVIFGGRDTSGVEPLALACALMGVRYCGYVVMDDVSCKEGQRDEIRRLLKPSASGVKF